MPSRAFNIVKLLGFGSYSQVFVAEDRKKKRTVVLKKIRKASTNSQYVIALKFPYYHDRLNNKY
jgi:serine/threonine protein kinase